MLRYAVLVTAATLPLLAAAPASAAIIIYDTPGDVQPEENVLFPDSTTANTVFGFTNQTNTQVTFTSDQVITNSESRGQARITADGALTDLDFFLSDMSGFTEVEFNLFDALDGGFVDLTFNTSDGIKTETFAIGNGQNFFGAIATDGDFITRVSFNTSGAGVQDIRQIRIGGINEQIGAVPEPGTWAMMLLGFGAIGFGMRRRKSTEKGQRVRVAYS